MKLWEGQQTNYCHAAYHAARSELSAVCSVSFYDRRRVVNRRLPRWLSAQEIADLALEGLPTSRYRVTQRADKERWSFKDRPKKDGGRLYAVTSLPIDARADLIARHQATAASEQAQPRNPVGRPRGSDPSSPETRTSKGLLWAGLHNAHYRLPRSWS